MKLNGYLVKRRKLFTVILSSRLITKAVLDRLFRILIANYFLILFYFFIFYFFLYQRVSELFSTLTPTGSSLNTKLLLLSACI